MQVEEKDQGVWKPENLYLAVLGQREEFKYMVEYTPQSRLSSLDAKICIQ